MNWGFVGVTQRSFVKRGWYLPVCFRRVFVEVKETNSPGIVHAMQFAVSSSHFVDRSLSFVRLKSGNWEEAAGEAEIQVRFGTPFRINRPQHCRLTTYSHLTLTLLSPF